MSKFNRMIEASTSEKPKQSPVTETAAQKEKAAPVVTDTEIKTPPQKIGIFIFIGIFASIAAAVFSGLALVTDHSVTKNHYDASLQGLWKAQKSEFAVQQSENNEHFTALNTAIKALEASHTEIKSAMMKLNDNVQLLNHNLTQVQDNMLAQMKHIGAPDLSKIESAIAHLKTVKLTEPTIEKTNKTPESIKTPSIEDTVPVKTIQNNNILRYLGNTPNGAVVSLNGEYITLKVGEKTPLGIVTLISNHEIIIGNQTYLYHNNEK